MLSLDVQIEVPAELEIQLPTAEMMRAAGAAVVAVVRSRALRSVDHSGKRLGYNAENFAEHVTFDAEKGQVICEGIHHSGLARMELIKAHENAGRGSFMTPGAEDDAAAAAAAERVLREHEVKLIEKGRLRL